jgi:hypothetical protein
MEIEKSKQVEAGSSKNKYIDNMAIAAFGTILQIISRNPNGLRVFYLTIFAHHAIRSG